MVEDRLLTLANLQDLVDNALLEYGAEQDPVKWQYLYGKFIGLCEAQQLLKRKPRKSNPAKEGT